jgi:hypothetical protein
MPIQANDILDPGQHQNTGQDWHLCTPFKSSITAVPTAVLLLAYKLCGDTDSTHSLILRHVERYIAFAISDIFHGLTCKSASHYLLVQLENSERIHGPRFDISLGFDIAAS